MAYERKFLYKYYFRQKMPFLPLIVPKYETNRWSDQDTTRHDTEGIAWVWRMGNHSKVEKM